MQPRFPKMTNARWGATNVTRRTKKTPHEAGCGTLWRRFASLTQRPLLAVLVVLGVDEERLRALRNDVCLDDNFLHAFERRQIEHDLEQAALEYRTQPARAGLALHGAFGHRDERVVANLELDAFELEQLLILLHERVLRLGEDLYQRLLVELIEDGDHRQTADELRDQTVLDQIFRLDRAQHVAHFTLVGPALDLRAETDTAFLRARRNHFLQT